MNSVLFLFLLILFASTVYSEVIFPTILYTHQSQSISTPQWLEFFTLCLAPLVAHIAGGVASPTLLGDPSPSPNWSARITHFNPISIIWRYYAIADRRLRARAWDEADMAACNAVFWDGETRRWDGSEEIMVRSRAWITKMPEKKHVPLLSASTVVTGVLTLQGVQSLFLIISALILSMPSFGYGLSTIFLPLGCLGIIRLPAAFWLSNDYGYLSAVEGTGRRVAETHHDHLVSDKPGLPMVTDRLLDDTCVGDRLVDIQSWKGRVYRVWWALSVLVLLGVSAASTTKIWWGYHPSLPYTSVSRVTFQGMYLVLTVCTVLIHLFYVLTGNTRTTLIPCIHATWYKVFTVLLMLTAVVCLVLSALETRTLRNGIVTSLPEFYCAPGAPLCVPTASGQGNTNI
jgi:hypothetical protein